MRTPSRIAYQKGHVRTGDLIQRVRAAYLEMPGLEMKAEHVQHLRGIERTICQMVLDSLDAGIASTRRS
jgi:hypothetical protein